MWRGEREAFDVLRNNVEEGAQYVWFHAASLGEFEQGRPLIEELRRTHPQYKILLTFFSPSGYEVRKNYEGADIVCYLPLDTPINARRFLRLVHPVMAFFIKYEFGIITYTSLSIGVCPHIALVASSVASKYFSVGMAKAMQRCWLASRASLFRTSKVATCLPQ